MRWKYIGAGLLFLLTGSFIDNVRGPLLPIFTENFSLTYTQTSVFLVSAYVAAIFCTFSLIPLMNKFGELKVALGSAIFASVTCLYSPQIGGYGALLAFGILLGTSVSTLGASSNILMLKGSPPGRQTQFLCGLHSMYGLGSFVAPLFLSFLLSNSRPWYWTLTIIPPILLFLSVIFLLIARKDPVSKQEGPQPIKLTKTQVLILITLGGYVGAEVMVSMWMTTYLVKIHQLSVQNAAFYLSGFFATMMATRFICIFIIKEKYEWILMWGSLFVGMVAFFLGRSGVAMAFAATGLLGPFFPIYFSRFSRLYPAQWRSISVWMLVAMQVTLTLCHFTVGKVTDKLGIEAAYGLPFVFFLITIAGLWTLQKAEARMR